jgi:predicted 2-oxoglutarate/Fe(II)-dependent dioxygenase YbiX
MPNPAMSNTDFLARFGFFIRRGFLSPDLCDQIRVEANQAKYRPAEIVRQGSVVFDSTVRHTKMVKLSSATQSLIRKGFQEIKAELEAHFTERLTDCETPGVLQYKEGDFFKIHKDRDYDDESTVIQKRLISVVVFLNSQVKSPGPEGFCGGSLNFFGLANSPAWQKYGFPLAGETGLLVAFRSNIPHEVTTVTSGERYTAVTWFH